ncbi:MAG: hypothetical protein JST62_02545 [Bacteroidetes bacterium]|nr:hypothetical protein [Bacteroidota bacterium]
MQNLLELEEKIFFECQNILDSLSKINSKDELLSKQELFYKLTERISFLKLLEKNQEIFRTESILQPSEQEADALTENEMLIDKGDITQPEDEELEEVIFNNELNEIEPLDTVEVQTSVETPKIHSESHFNNSEIEEIPNQSIDDEPIAELIKEDVVPETIIETPSDNTENRGKIIDFENKIVPSVEKTEIDKEENTFHTEQKVNLAPIKGMKIIQSLFDDDPLERIQENTPNAPKSNIITSSDATNVSTPSKKNIEFRLDMNDKIAFSKNLFGGSQSEMNDTINILNSFKTLDEAKEYLSDIYYEKKWEKVDDYAQRLWTLVENKFL